MDSTSSNPGCLSVILGFLGLGSTEKYPYRKRDDFLSPAEHSFYLVLRQVIDSSMVICPKVNLADIIFVSTQRSYMTAFNRINRKHIDFLVCDLMTMKPNFAIELDDASHHRKSREERDEFVENVFKAAGLPLIRITARRSYNTAELGNILSGVLQSRTANTTEVASHLESTDRQFEITAQSQPQIKAPLCPKCGAPMVLRVAKNGDNPGQKFFGCSNYPKCRQVLPFKE